MLCLQTTKSDLPTTGKLGNQPDDHRYAFFQSVLQNVLHCKSTNFGVLLYLVNLSNYMFSRIFVAPTYVNYVDRTPHRRGDAKFNSRQITLF